jgi:hypothetical protein
LRRVGGGSPLLPNIALVPRDDEGDFLFAKNSDQLAVGFGGAECGVNDEDGDVGFVEHLLRFKDALCAEFAFVVDAGSIDYQHGTERQQFHRFLHGVGGGALDIGNNGKFLPGNGIDKARFARIAPPEKTYVYPLARRSLV